ncbi:LppU/SCO3897 family protein [Solwaraspora sp. WMMB335]|uniref:LppU/SCO3897 family protein n=1 Tax=Solwaraspora sp. WMMB335 TaxID=3404118 RepID=UPI003B95AFBA
MSHYGPPGGPYPGQQPDRWPDRQQPEHYREPSDPWGTNDPWGGDTPAGGPTHPWQGGSDPNWQAGQPAADPNWQAGQPAADPNWHTSQGPAHDPTWQGYGQPSPAGDPSWQASTQAGPGWSGANEATWQRGAGQPDYPTAEPAWDPGGEPGRQGGKGGGKGRRTSSALIAVLIGVAVLLCGGGAVGVYLMTRSESGDNGSEQALSTAEPQVSSSQDPSTTASPSPEPEQPTPTPTPTSSNDARFVQEGQCVRNEAESADDPPALTIAECDSGTYEVLARFDGITDGEDDAKTKCADVEGYTNWYFFNSQLDALDFVLCLRER